ncbi:hypothetical protein V7S43_007393 [Phytophthora oleae]|uniref:Uncharacterized protein n=1 Tax=Phytophthora oleae TaxID=2107226 RepID=A0ABD3FM94_9STRA
MAAMEKEFQGGITSLHDVQDTLKVANAAFTRDGLTQPAGVSEATQVVKATHADQATQEATLDELGSDNGWEDLECTGQRRRHKSGVVYVKIRRRERANVVVLSAEEKYCYTKAVFEPMMEHLSGLSSPAFFSALQTWKEIVRMGLGEACVTAEPASAPLEESGQTDGSNMSDTASDLAPAELIDTMNFIADFEQSDLSSDQPQTVRSQSVNAAPERTVVEAKKEIGTPVKHAAREDLKKNPSKPASREGIEVLRIPQLKPRHNQRKKLKQSRLEKSVKPQKLAAIQLPDQGMPSLSRVLEWAIHMVDPNHVSDILANYPIIMDNDFLGARAAKSEREFVVAADYDYNFVIPYNLVVKLKAVVEVEKQKRTKSRYFNDDSELDHPDGTTKETVAFIPGGTPRFTSGAVYRMARYYNLVKKFRAWIQDINWLLSTKWEEIRSHPELFDEETETAGLMPHFVPTKH